ncbi:hypothetical protein BBO99_00002656 [Phytophthora kernoviae]|uniref:START domain-containing protein n=1 Tax=Phytophthora kernoviae TaxID=325452 RepID=A0A3R7MNB1_9STRA|nr:hypothetical protein JM16_002758 [Phytophthora kernoviae]KAG2528428.1 hypothetical protein JM18_002630 [Phytophthora kernoviae]RLN14143.1 hypothetical protein BBI17_002600 [Phytophthora kernoviae]RLN82772.1 hypothetical protein BBO99_00002656 [Phytophthora kernoviae]
MSSSQSTLQLGNVEGFRHLAHSIVSRTLAVEVEYDRMGRPEQDEQAWKMIKRQNLLRAYKHKTRDTAQLDQSRSATSSKKPPMVICVGSVEGTVEDILYGMHAKNRSEMGATTTFMDRRPLDCDVLAVIDSGSDKDPFRHLSLKYLLTETFGNARVVSNRDLCAVQSMGFGLDSRGKRYGYYLLRSVNIPECSPLPADSDVVRANITMCCIYRQSKTSHTVNVYSKAMVDLGGSLPGFMAHRSLEGSLEDILYGTHSKNRDEMQATVAYLHNSHMDCAVLNVLDSGTDEDPYRQLTLKWFIAEMFGDARLVNHRDWLNIESTGMSTDAWGRRYGYFLAKHVEHPGCPPMPEDSDVVRGKMAMCCIYRQEPGSRVVDVYAKGSVDLGGGLPGFLTGFAPVAMMLSMEVSMQSAEGKRLTTIALDQVC